MENRSLRQIERREGDRRRKRERERRERDRTRSEEQRETDKDRERERGGEEEERETDRERKRQQGVSQFRLQNRSVEATTYELPSELEIELRLPAVSLATDPDCFPDSKR